jgi:hypothetical protein
VLTLLDDNYLAPATDVYSEMAKAFIGNQHDSAQGRRDFPAFSASQ